MGEKFELDTMKGITEEFSRSISYQKWYLRRNGLAAKCSLVSLCVKDRCVVSSESRQTMLNLLARTLNFLAKNHRHKKGGWGETS